MVRVDAALRDARRSLAPDGADGAEDSDAALLLAHVLDRPWSWLYAHGDAELAPGEAARFAELVAARREGQPVAYLTGRRGFRDFDLEVTPATLIPRPETELLVELSLAKLPADRALRLADLGTGSGAIALSLARERPRATVLATDASAEALAVAAGNAGRLDIGNVAFVAGHWWEAVAGARFDLVASNPPYVAAGDPHLARGDLRHEPPGALASGIDGLDAIREIAAGAAAHLVPDGWLLLEHGLDQGAAVRALLVGAGLAEVGTERDLEGRERVTAGCLRR